MVIPKDVLGDWLAAAGLDLDSRHITRVVIDLRSRGEVSASIEERGHHPEVPTRVSLPNLEAVMAAGVKGLVSEREGVDV